MPNVFQPITSNSSDAAKWAQAHKNFAQLDREAVTKVFKGPNGPRVIQGQLPYGGYGMLLYDDDGTPRVLIGTAPDDGRIGTWVSKPGQSVITLLGG